MPTIAQRFLALPAPSLESSLMLRPGSMRDYDALAPHHYRADRPATIARILVLAHHEPSLPARFALLSSPLLSYPPQSHPSSPNPACGFALPTSRTEQTPVALLVESFPVLSCRLRDQALINRYSNLRSLAARARVLTDEIRCISRVIVHPSWRGLGLAVRLVRAALDSSATPYTEAIAAMGKVNPFFEHAGMTAYHRPPHEHDARLAAALARVNLTPAALAHLPHAMTRIAALPAPDRAFLEHELRRWQSRTRRPQPPRISTPAPSHPAHTHPACGFALPDLLRAARERIASEPVYYLHRNRAP